MPVFYVDYGNKAQVAIVDSVAALPARYKNVICPHPLSCVLSATVDLFMMNLAIIKIHLFFSHLLGFPLPTLQPSPMNLVLPA